MILVTWRRGGGNIEILRMRDMLGFAPKGGGLRGTVMRDCGESARVGKGVFLTLALGE